MVIKAGEALPSGNFFKMSGDDVVVFNTDDVFGGKRVLVIGVVGAFTPVCGVRHLPDYLPMADKFKSSGAVDQIVCLCAADPFVMKAWAESIGVQDDKILMLTDNNADFAHILGLSVDLSSLGLARRSTRFTLLADDRRVEEVFVESEFHQVEVTTAEAMMKLIAA